MKKRLNQYTRNLHGCKKFVRCLKLTVLLLVMGAIQATASSAYAQGVRLNLNMKNVSIDKVFQEITKQSKLEFFFSNDDLNVKKSVSVNVSNGTVDEALHQILGNGYTYRIADKLITIEVVKKSSAKMSTDDGKSRVISGKVLDPKGVTLPGATVKLKGSQVAVTTNVNGEFKITVPGNVKVLEFSFIGYKSKNVEIENKSTLTVTFEESSQAIDEVVVTGMQKTDKRLFTGASTKLSAESVKVSGLPEISRALEGRAAGVSVQNVSGTFGTAPKIRVRGATSIFGSSKPLWVVDGVIIEDVIEVSADALSSGDATTLISSAIAGLNADDIESFQVLKDGSATSIYGARAMAGVIVITTKKGKSGQSTINYSGEYTVRMKPSYSNFNIMNSQDQMSVYQEMAQKGWLNYADVAGASSSGVYGKMYQLASSYDPATGQYGVTNTADGRAAYLRSAEMRNTDWFSALFRTNLVQTHSVSISSGTDKGSYYASVSAMNDPGWANRSSVERYTTNLNANYNILKNLSLNMISSSSFRKQMAPGTLGQQTDVVSGEVKRDFDINPYSYALNTSRTLERNTSYQRNYAPFNIFDELENNYIDLNVVDLKFQGELKWKPFSKLEISALGAVKYQATSQEHNILDNSNQAMAYRAMGTTTIRDNNPFLYTDPENQYALPVTVLPQGGIYARNDYNMLAYDFRTTASYNNTFFDNHIVSLFGGMETNSTERHQTWFRGWGLQYSMGEIPFYAYQVFKKGKEENTDYYSLDNTSQRNVAFFANGTYSYKGKYVVNGTARYEGSNKLGKSRSSRWLPTWNVSGSWNVHEEDFFKMADPILSNLTLRASYSLTADRGPSFVTNSRVVIKSSTPWRPTAGVQETALSIDGLENADLTYEKKHELNLGIDVGFLKRRINISGDWYQRRNYDLIGQVTTQGLGGQVTKYGNTAAMKSSGAEFAISTKNIVTRDFSWTTDIVYAHMTNEVTKLENSVRVIDMVTGQGFAMVGYPVRSIFSIPFKGLNADGIPTFINQDGVVTTSGVYFQERKKLDFLKYSGSADPTDVGSFANAFTYKNLTFNAFVTYSFGNVIRLDPVFKGSYNDLVSMPKEFENRWVVPGDELITNVPAIASVRQLKLDSKLGYAYNAYNYSDARIADGGFVRMKEISLLYSFNKSLIKRWNLTNLAIKVQATNLFLIYADKKLNGQDPEFFNTGGVAAPVPKQFTLTLKVGL